VIQHGLAEHATGRVVRAQDQHIARNTFPNESRT
jgi:hypothetical protein